MVLRGGHLKFHFTCKLGIFQTQTNNKSVRQCKPCTQTNFWHSTRKYLWLSCYYSNITLFEVHSFCLWHFLWANKTNSNIKQEINISWRHLTLVKFTNNKISCYVHGWVDGVSWFVLCCFLFQYYIFLDFHNKTNVK